MLETLLITWRETLEAALVVGILLTYVARSGQRRALRYVWLGSAAAVVAALICASASGGAMALLGGETQEVVQALIVFGAVGVLSWMIVWMHRSSHSIQGNLHRQADSALATGRLIGLAAIAFVAVFREGVETMLFLWGVVVQRGMQLATMPLVGAGLVGAGLAVATAWLFFRGFSFLSLRTFFRTTGVLLLLVAAGLLTSGVNKLIGLGYLPPLVPQVWNTSWLVRDGSPLGALLGALVGYRSRPSLLEVLAFAFYFPPMLWALNHAETATRAAGLGDESARPAA
ncbi:MAG TPA: FTR1 family protein [Candidatus Binatus sp.]|nr:FTR1 family protein [Candidatus Binatus sp.]